MANKVRPLPTKPGRKRVPDERSPLGPGTQITPNVRLVSRIGEGAMGSIWLADHQALKTQVAVKCISGGVPAEDDEGLARFRREASTAAQIKSPHVTHVLDTGVTDAGIPYIVMEYLEGETLGERLQRSGWLRLPQAARIVAHVGKALNSAHSVGVIHRDIKPDNIYLMQTDDGVFCKVLDFGIAKQTRVPSIRGLTDEGKVLGTLEYMSPEQMMKQGAVDYRADLWALGVVAYCTLTGRLPFSGSNMGELCLNIINRRYAPPGSFRKDLPAAIDEWFARAFHQQPTDRFASAKEMALAFVAVAEQTGDTLSAELRETGSHPLALPPQVHAAPTKITDKAKRPKTTDDDEPGAPEQRDDSPAAAVATELTPTAAVEPTEPLAAAAVKLIEPAPTASEAAPTRGSRVKTGAFLVAALVVVAALAFGAGRLGSAPATETTATHAPSEQPIQATATSEPETATTRPAETEPEVTATATAEPESTTSATTSTAPPEPPPHGTLRRASPPRPPRPPKAGFPVPDDPDF